MLITNGKWPYCIHMKLNPLYNRVKTIVPITHRTNGIKASGRFCGKSIHWYILFTIIQLSNILPLKYPRFAEGKQWLHLHILLVSELYVHHTSHCTWWVLKMYGNVFGLIEINLYICFFFLSNFCCYSFKLVSEITTENC